MVGFSQFQGATHAFFWENAKVTDLGTLGLPNSQAYGINSFGQVVGQSNTSNNRTHAFLYSEGQMIDLNNQIGDPSWELGPATGINDAGQIVGYGMHTPLGQRAYLLTPTNNVIIPDHGGNTGNVTARIVYPGIQTGATVKLATAGQPNIVGNHTTTISTSTANVLQTTFDLAGATLGIRQVVLTQPDGSIITLPGVFTIEQGGAPDVWVDIIGWDKLRAGRPQTYYILCGNRGNIDSSSGTVWVGLPDFLSATLQPDQAETASFSTGNMTFVVYGVAPVAPANTVILPLLITAPDSPQYAHQPVQFKTWFSLE